MPLMGIERRIDFQSQFMLFYSTKRLNKVKATNFLISDLFKPDKTIFPQRSISRGVVPF